MEKYREDFVKLLADSGALFFKEGLNLKDERPTPYFVNMGVFGNHTSLREKVGQAYARMIKDKIDEGVKINIVFGSSYKASMIAGDATFALWIKEKIDLGCSYDRKEVKDHGEGSDNGNVIVGAEFFDGANIYMVDDVLTSAETKKEVLEKIAQESRIKGIKTNVVGVGIAFDREQVNLWGRNAIRDFTDETEIPVDSIVGARGSMRFLFESQHPLMINGARQSMTQIIYDDFQEYMGEYGTK